MASSRVQHFIRSVAGSRRRFCPACGKKWVDKIPAPRPMWVMAAMILLAAASAVNMIRSMDAEYRSPRSRGKIALPGGAAGPSPSDLAAQAARSKGAAVPGAGNPNAPDRPGSEAAPPFEDPGMVEVDDLREEASLFDLVGDLLEMAMNSLKGLVGFGPSASELERMDKKELWKKYGHLFGSKNEAKKSYDDYLNKKKSEEAGGR